MEKRVNIRDVAKAAQVSTASVSRALESTPSPYLSQAQREHILRVCREMHYQPNAHARRLFARRANTMTIFFSAPEDCSHWRPYPVMDEPFSSCLLGLNSVLARAGIQLLLTELTPAFLQEQRHLSMCRSRMVDAIFLWGCLQDDGYIHELLHEKIPLVMLQNDWPDAPCPSVVADDYAGSCDMTGRLLAAGHRRIAILRPWLHGSAGIARYRGVIDTLARHGLQPAFQSTDCGYDYDFGRRAAAELLRNAPDATAIVASNDTAAWGCVDELEARGLSVPEDFSLTGGDDIRNFNRMQLCTFASPAYRVGQTGAELMLRHLKNEDIRGRHCLPVVPVAGNTVAPPRRS